MKKMGSSRLSLLVLLGLLLCFVLLISSEVAARDLAQTSSKVAIMIPAPGERAKEIHVSDNDAKYGGNGGYQGGGGYPGQGGNGGYQRDHGSHGGNSGSRGGYRNGGHCRYGCCGRGYYENGCRCCSYAGEAADVETAGANKPRN